MLSKITWNMHIHCGKIIKYKKEGKSSEKSPLKIKIITINVLLYILLDYMYVYIFIGICYKQK